MRRNSDEGIQAALRERKAIDDRLEALVARLDPTHQGFKIAETGPIRGEKVSGSYRVTAGNHLGDPAIFFGSTGGAAGVCGEKLVLYCGSVADYEQLKNVRKLERYYLELAEDNAAWRWVDSKNRYFDSTDLADEALRWLLKEYEKQRQDDIARRRR
jgi:hypothetical protein